MRACDKRATNVEASQRCCSVDLLVDAACGIFGGLSQDSSLSYPALEVALKARDPGGHTHAHTDRSTKAERA